MKQQLKNILAMAALVVLAACGGGQASKLADGNRAQANADPTTGTSGGTANAVSQSVAQKAETIDYSKIDIAKQPWGIWVGGTYQDMEVSGYWLDDSDVWLVFTRGGRTQRIFHGKPALTGSSFTLRGVERSFGPDNTVAKTYTGTFNPRTELSLLSEDGTKSTLNFDNWYDGNRTAEGNFFGSFTFGSASYWFSVLSVYSDGGASITFTSSDCSARGYIARHPSGKNLLNAQFTLSGSQCPSGGGLARGFVLTDTAGRSVAVIAAKSDASIDMVFVGGNGV